MNKIHARTDQDSQQHDVQALKNEVKELKALFAAMTTTQQQTAVTGTGEPTPKPVSSGGVWILKW